MGAVVDTAGTLTGAATGLGGALSSGAKGLGRTIQGNGGILGQEGGAPDLAKIQQGTSIQDVQGAQNAAGNSLEAQQNLLRALQGQGGLGMQNTAAGLQQNFANQLAAANGVGAQQGAIAGLQNTAGLYQNIANGAGPNPAQAMLNQATGQNVANQAALMAGQRGASSNIGLIARQAAQQGAATQQQAVGQGATMQANQQLNALAGLTGAQQAVGGLGGNLTNQQNAANQVYGNQANQIAGQQIGQANTNANAALQNQSQMQNALQGVNNANVGSQSSLNSGNVDLSKTNTAGKQAIVGGIFNGAGSALGALGARGGEVHMAGGGMTPMNPEPAQNMTPMNQQGPASSFGQYLASTPTDTNNVEKSNDLLKQDKYDYSSKGPEALQMGASNLAKGGAKAALAAAAAKGGLAKGGGHVAAKNEKEKAKSAGNSYSNDKIPAMLSEGEIVLPRSVTKSKDPVGSSAKFVAQVLAKRRVGS